MEDIQVIIKNIEERTCNQFDIDEWDARLIQCYSVYLSHRDKEYCFKWVMAGDPENPIPEAYDEMDEYDKFLLTIQEGIAWKKAKSFVWKVEETIQMSLHRLYSKDSTLKFPKVISMKEI